jgi:hypothetical protein
MALLGTRISNLAIKTGEQANHFIFYILYFAILSQIEKNLFNFELNLEAVHTVKNLNLNKFIINR